MQLSLSSKKVMLLAPVFFVLFTFFIPISPTIKSICFVCSLIAILIVPQYRNNIREAYSTLWGRAGAILFIYIVIATLWSPAPYLDQLGVVGKYCKLIYLPLLAVGFIHPKVRAWSINAYLLAIFITCIISMLKALNLIQSPDPGMVFYNHIITGFMVALAAYLAGLEAVKSTGWTRNTYIFLLVFTSYQVLFINTGRTGYLVYMVLMALLLLQTLSVKQALIGLFVFSASIGLVYQFSPVMQIRTSELVTDIQQLRHNNKNTSLGYRIQFHNYAKQLMMKSPWIGIGTGGFKYSFAKDDPVPTWGKELTDPHSQYWMILAEQGIIGLVLFIVFLASLFITAFRISSGRPILLGVLIAFCIGSLSDTILCYSTAGYLLIVLSALCFGELLASKKASLNDEAIQNDSSLLNNSGGAAAL